MIALEKLEADVRAIAAKVRTCLIVGVVCFIAGCLIGAVLW